MCLIIDMSEQWGIVFSIAADIFFTIILFSIGTPFYRPISLKRDKKE